jgi:hypothetical protein
LVNPQEMITSSAFIAAALTSSSHWAMVTCTGNIKTHRQGTQPTSPTHIPFASHSNY